MRGGKKLALVVLASVGLPLVLGVGLLFFVAVIDDDEAAATPIPAGSENLDPAKVPQRYHDLLRSAAEDCPGLSVAVLAAQLKQESGFNPKARSSAGAMGIAQFMPGTWASSGIDGNGDGKKDVWNPEDAIPSQGRMMCKLLATAKKHPRYRGSPTELALAGYNAGWGRVEQYRGVPPASFAGGQTYHYVQTIMTLASTLALSDGGGRWTRPVAAPVGTAYGAGGAAWSSGTHTGVDFTASAGTPVKAAGPGTIEVAGDGGSYGNQVVVRHDDGKYTQYAHLSKISVRQGQSVRGGTVLGRSGSTGNASGPHLHFEARTTPAYGSDIDPLAYLRSKGVTVK